MSMYAHKVTYKNKNKHIQTKYELNMAIVMIFVKTPFKTYESQKLINILSKILGNEGLDNYQSKYHIKVKVVCI